MRTDIPAIRRKDAVAVRKIEQAAKLRQLSLRDQPVNVCKRRTEVRSSAAIKRKMLHIPLKFIQICQQRVLLHLAVAL